MLRAPLENRHLPTGAELGEFLFKPQKQRALVAASLIFFLLLSSVSHTSASSFQRAYVALDLFFFSGFFLLSLHPSPSSLTLSALHIALPQEVCEVGGSGGAGGGGGREERTSPEMRLSLNVPCSFARNLGQKNNNNKKKQPTLKVCAAFRS